MAFAGVTSASAVSMQFQRTCFACGVDNPHGLRLEFCFDPDGTATASWVPDIQWEGARGIVHGGIVTTLLDEAMAKAVAATGCKSLTADLRVRFHRYTKTGEVLQVRGWIAKHRKRLIETEATVIAPDGSERAHAWARFLVVTKSRAPAQA
jgi:acyl-coenzyme A thioesterase PaaI-like protein